MDDISGQFVSILNGFARALVIYALKSCKIAKYDENVPITRPEVRLAYAKESNAFSPLCSFPEFV